MLVSTNLKKRIKIEFKLFELMSKNLALGGVSLLDLWHIHTTSTLSFHRSIFLSVLSEKETFHAMTKITM